MNSFIFIRHGQSQANLNGYVADANSDLTKEGKKQINKAASLLKSKNIKIIVSSPYKRCVQSAEIIAKRLNIKNVEVIDELKERGLGHYESHPRQFDPSYYFTVEGKEDVEPLGVLIARCEAALGKIKKLAPENGNVLVVGHVIEGFYLQQVAGGKRLISDFDAPTQIQNAQIKTVQIFKPRPAKFTRQSALAYAALIAGTVLLIIGLIMLFNQPAKNQNPPKANIPINSDTSGDQLQNASSPLQVQSGDASQSSNIGNQLQPVVNGIPNNWQ